MGERKAIMKKILATVIPAEYVETSYSFYIRLSNEPYGFTGGDTEKGSMVDITVRCMEPMK